MRCVFVPHHTTRLPLRAAIASTTLSDYRTPYLFQEARQKGVVAGHEVSMEGIGLAISVIDIALRSFQFLRNAHNAERDHAGLIESVSRRIQALRDNLKQYEDATHPTSFPGHVLDHIKEEFHVINADLDKILQTRVNKRALIKFAKGSRTLSLLQSISSRIHDLERDVDRFGLASAVQTTLKYEHELIKKTVEEASGKIEEVSSKVGFDIKKMFDALSETVLQGLELKKLPPKKSSFCEDDDETMTEAELSDSEDDSAETRFKEMEAKVYDAFQKLSSCGVSEEVRQHLAKGLSDACHGWRVNDDKVKFHHHENGRSIVLGSGTSAEVYRGHMVREEAAPLRVAVKQLKSLQSDAVERQVEVLREVFLQMHCAHRCIVRIYGAHWPSTTEYNTTTPSSTPYIVMERMTHNLRGAVEKQLVQGPEEQRNVLCDIASALDFLHSRSIVHRDVKPENVLLRFEKGERVGPAKLSDFGNSCQNSTPSQDSCRDAECGAQGTFAFMPPEVLADAAQCAVQASWDVWSFGVLVSCMASKKRMKLADAKVFSAQNLARGGEMRKFAKDCEDGIEDERLRKVAKACLRQKPEDRPEMKSVAHVLRQDDVSEGTFDILGEDEKVATNLRVREMFMHNSAPCDTRENKPGMRKS